MKSKNLVQKSIYEVNMQSEHKKKTHNLCRAVGSLGKTILQTVGGRNESNCIRYLWRVDFLLLYSSPQSHSPETHPVVLLEPGIIQN